MGLVRVLARGGRLQRQRKSPNGRLLAGHRRLVHPGRQRPDDGRRRDLLGASRRTPGIPRVPGAEVVPLDPLTTSTRDT